MKPEHLYRTNSEKALLAASVIELLYSALCLDPKAISQLLEHRVPCNKDLAYHATIQSVPEQVSNTSGAAQLVTVYKVGLLGLLNGIIGVDSNSEGILQAVYADNDISTVIGFELSAVGQQWLAEARSPKV